MEFKTVKGVLTMRDMSESDAQLIREGLSPYKDFIPTGKILFTDNNVITSGGDQRIAELVGGISSDFVRKLGIGDGGVSPGDPTVPLAPTKADTALVNEVKRNDPIPSVSVLTSPDYQLQFVETFFSTDPGLAPPTDYTPTFPGRVINEAGLYTIDDVLFARKTFVPLPFEVGDRPGIICQWTIHVL